jgi:5-methylcytosine-specific restriction protein B
MTKNNIHETAYQFMEAHRAKYPDFYYWLRMKDRKDKDTGDSKFDKGLWFQGNDGYAFVGLYDRSGGSNMTRSIGLVFVEREGQITGYLELVHNEEKDPKILAFYQALMELVGGFEKTGKTKFVKEFEEKDFLKASTTFLAEVKPRIDDLVRQMGVEYLFIKPEKFDKLHGRILNLRSEQAQTTIVNNDPKYWLYAPGKKAIKWDEFYEEGIMGLGWSELGDLTLLGDKANITKVIQETYSTDSASYNSALANFDFRDTLAVGDIIIAKKGRKKYIGYGIVASDYYYDESRKEYPSCRKVNWIKRGEWIEEKTGGIVVKTLTDITKYEEYVENLNQLIGIGLEKKVKNDNVMSHSLNTILYGPPGTGKTYQTILKAAQIVTRTSLDDYEKAKEIFNKHLGDRIEFITFHQNYSYEDFIQGLRPDVDSGRDLSFERKDGVFKRIADRAMANINASDKPNELKKKFDLVFNEFTNPLMEGEEEEIEIQMKKRPFYITDIGDKSISFRKPSGGTGHTLSIATLRRMYETESIGTIQGLSVYYEPFLEKLLSLGKQEGIVSPVEKENYVIIIDEINRANISRVFGELITLIEPDKRSHGKIPLRCTLPSDEEFMVPSNLYIIGTMNTADKSIALLDIALRRRFEFEAMYPKYDLPDHKIHDSDVLRKINERIVITKGHDFQIGHAYFMDAKIGLKDRMNKKVIPLLMEYYMNDKKEVEGILGNAGLAIEKDSWPLRITGKL